MADLDPKIGIWIVLGLLLLLLFVMLYSCWDKKLIESHSGQQGHRRYKESKRTSDSHLQICVMDDGQMEMTERNTEEPAIIGGNMEASYDRTFESYNDIKTETKENKTKQSDSEDITQEGFVYEIV